MTIRRLKKELTDFENDPPTGYSIGLADENDLYLWIANISGKENSLYAGGLFSVEFRIPLDYPFKPPRVRFLTRIYHPNINEKGDICLDFKEPMSPAITIRRVMTSIVSILENPNPDDPLMPEIAK